MSVQALSKNNIAIVCFKQLYFSPFKLLYAQYIFVAAWLGEREQSWLTRLEFTKYMSGISNREDPDQTSFEAV